MFEEFCLRNNVCFYFDYNFKLTIPQTTTYHLVLNEYNWYSKKRRKTHKYVYVWYIVYIILENVVIARTEVHRERCWSKVFYLTR